MPPQLYDITRTRKRKYIADLLFAIDKKEHQESKEIFSSLDI